MGAATVLWCTSASARLRPQQPSPERRADYRIEARLDADPPRVHGRLELTWRSPAAEPIATVPLHLYMNAFRTPETTWMTRAERHHRGTRPGEDAPWGYCEIASIRQRRADGTWAELGAKERADPTLADVALDHPVNPGESLVLAIEFTTVLPEVFARTGFRRDFYMIGQWFPKLARHDGARWADFVFHYYGEFYADFGDYEVVLNVPAEMVVGATGERVDASIAEDRATFTYRAEAVHDFAWTAWPRFEVDTRQVGEIAVHVLGREESRADRQDTWEAIEASLTHLERRFGTYPWTSLTVVQPPSFAAGASGMEYPTLVTTEPAASLPGWLRGLGFDHRLGGVLTTVHELGHQYFQGLVASNEDAEPWLDEGLTTLAGVLVLEDHAPGDAWLVRIAGHELASADLLRLSLRGRFRGDPSAAPAEAFDPATQSFGTAVYQAPAALLLTLRNLVGPATFDPVLSAYAQTYRFGHPRTADFERVLVEGLGRSPLLGQGLMPDDPPVVLDVPALLRQGLHDTAEVGFAVRRVGNVGRSERGGWTRTDAGWQLEPDSPRVPTGTVVLERTGDFVVPVEVEVEFADGTVSRGWWSGRERARVLRYPGRRVVRASLDPRGRLVLEPDRSDNHRYAPGPTRRGAATALGAASEALAWAVLLLVTA